MDAPLLSDSTRVLFVHGLESGPGGTKMRYLMKYFTVDCPDMHMSAYNPFKANGPSRWLLVLAVATLGGCLAAPSWRLKAGVACVGVGLSVPVARWRMRRALEACVHLQALAIKDFRPDVLVGSSWGGAVALRAMEKGIWTGPVVLMAPATATRGAWRLVWPEWQPELSAAAASCCILVHGADDDTVPPAASRELAQRCDLAEFIEEAAGDHRLNDALLTSTEEFAQGKLHFLISKASKL